MKSNEMGVTYKPIYMCSTNKDVDEINKSLIKMRINRLFFKKPVNFYSHTKDGVLEIKTLPINNLLFLKEITERGDKIFKAIIT